MSSRDELSQRLQRAIRYLIAFSIISNEQIARDVGLNSIDQQAMGLIELVGRPMTAGELAALAKIPTSTVTRVIDRLVAAGYVDRTADPSDRRKVLVEINRAKQQSLWKYYRQYADDMEHANAQFTVTELETIARYLELMRPAEEQQGL
ncbi:MAG: MarR family transcriptional regulator [Rhodoglobus sp.]